MMADVAAAPWFRHLDATCLHTSRAAAAPSSCTFASLCETMPPPHVASIALPVASSAAQHEMAFELGRDLRRRGAFVIVTTAEPNAAILEHIGHAFDCVLRGDGGALHHAYPVRTVVEPASGRLVCYDLYDVCSLWAGKVGDFGVVDPQADALHVEMSSSVSTLEDIDALAADLSAGLDEPGNLRLINVVQGVSLSAATPVSFSSASSIEQGRATARGSARRNR